MKNKALYKSIIALALSLTLMVGVAFAWLTNGANANNLILFTGDMDLEFAVYGAIDDNKDGVFERKEGSQNVKAYNECTRQEKIDDFFTPIDKIGGRQYNEFVPGNKVHIKIVVKNSSQSIRAKLDVAFSSLDDYFFDGVKYYSYANDSFGYTNGETGNINDTLYAQRAARSIFGIRALTVRTYGDNGNSFNTIKASSAADDIANGVTAIDGITADQNLFAVSNGENFLDGTIIDTNELMEIDFDLEYLQVNYIAEVYPAYCNDENGTLLPRLVKLFKDEYFSSETDDVNATNAAQAYITAFIAGEMRYLIASDDTVGANYDNGFTIDNIVIMGTQV